MVRKGGVVAQGKSGRGLAGVPALSLMFTGASVVPIKVCCNLKVEYEKSLPTVFAFKRPNLLLY